MSENNGGDFRNLFKLTNSISSSFRTMKFVVIASLAVAAAVPIGCVYMTQKGVAERGRQVYVIDVAGTAYGATARDGAEMLDAEARDQLRRFHELFFSVPPNSDVIRKNLEQAMEISDKSAYRYYNDLQETGFYKRLTQTGASQQVVVDSIRLDLRSHPYKALTYCTQYIVRESNVTKFSLVTTCELEQVQRTEKNVHGLQLRKFDVIDNTQISQRKR